MSYHLDDTIAAIGTAPDGAARGMIRVSGPDAVAIIAKCFWPDDEQPLDSLWFARVLTGQVRADRGWHALSHSAGRVTHLVPCDLFLWPTNRSYTRQPVAELHMVGSPPVLDAVLAAVCDAGARLAEPGEFTLRAFLAGRIDLTQAEAVLGVIDARGQDELNSSLAQLAGGLARPLQELRDDLLQLLAELEAGLDFVEEDIRFIAAEELIERLETAIERLESVVDQMASRLTTTKAEQVAIIGPPNAGKSSLFNSLVVSYGAPISASRHLPQGALVSSDCGTTRDYLTAAIELDGIRCELVDTAGVDHRRANPIEAAAQDLASQRRETATIRVWCSEFANTTEPPADCDVVVLTKADLFRIPQEMPASRFARKPQIITSSHTGAGLEELCDVLRRLLARESTPQSRPVVAATAERCRESVRSAVIALRSAVELVRSDTGDELVAAEVRDGLTELGKVVGAVYTDDLLDRIFSSFCVGK